MVGFPAPLPRFGFGEPVSEALVSAPLPPSAAPASDAPAAAPAAGEEGEGEGEDGLADAADATGVELECFSVLGAFLSTYPHIVPLVGGEPSLATVRSLLRDYKHEQRSDASLMASVPLLSGAGTLKGGSTPGGKRGSVVSGNASISRSHANSRASSVRGSTKGLGERRQSGGKLGSVPEEDVMQTSRVSSVRSARSSSSQGGDGGVRGGGGGGGALSEQALLARQQTGGTPCSSGAPSTIDRAGGGVGKIGRDGTMSSVIGSERPESHAGLTERRSMDGRASMAGTLASSAGTAVSDASKGEPPFVDPVAKVQRLQRSRLHGRFQREARVQRRWEELKAMAAQMQQEQSLAQRAR